MYVVFRATFKNMGARSLSRNWEIPVAGPWMEAMIGRSGVFGYEKNREYNQLTVLPFLILPCVLWE